MPIIQSARVQPGTGKIQFVSSNTGSTIVPATSASSGASTFHFAVTSPSDGVPITDGAIQNGNSVSLLLRSLKGAGDISLSVDNSVITITAPQRPGPTGPIGPPGPTGAAGSDSNVYHNAAYPSLTTTQLALDYLLYVAPVITSFTNSLNIVEIGSTIVSVNLAWSFNKTMTFLTLDGVGITPSLTARSLTGLSLTTNKTWTLVAGDGTNTTSRITTLSFQPKRWWGTSTNTSLSSSDILTLQNSEFATSRVQTKIISSSAAYIYFAYPTTFGAATFTVNGLLNTAWTQSTVLHTNASGYQQNYFVYRSNTLQNGSNLSITVS